MKSTQEGQGLACIPRSGWDFIFRTYSQRGQTGNTHAGEDTLFPFAFLLSTGTVPGKGEKGVKAEGDFWAGGDYFLYIPHLPERIPIISLPLTYAISCLYFMERNNVRTQIRKLEKGLGEEGFNVDSILFLCSCLRCSSDVLIVDSTYPVIMCCAVLCYGMLWTYL